MQRIAESELIINKRGAVYHLDLRPEELATTVITVGDPDRVELVSHHFDAIEHKRQHREFVTHTGRIGSKRVSVISTGIGPDNIDIVLNELDAVVNIDLETRTVKAEHTALNIIRIGTSGSLQPDVPADAFVASTLGLGLDNLLQFYRADATEEERQLLHAFATHTQMQSGTAYICAAAPSLLKHFVHRFHHGITVTCPGFYAPQGRVLRLGLRYPQLVNSLTTFQFGQHRITNFEMETSAIYGLSRLLGHHALSLSAIVANRVQQTFSGDAAKAVETLIEHALNTIEAI